MILLNYIYNEERNQIQRMDLDKKINDITSVCIYFYKYAATKFKMIFKMKISETRLLYVPRHLNDLSK